MDKQLAVENVLFHVTVRQLTFLTVSLPLLSLLICFVTSMLFSFTLVNTTVCKVYNFCPSVSAITGISPQRYIWRVGVALHCAPRFLLASLYYKHYHGRIKYVAPEKRGRYRRTVTLTYWLNVAEVMALVGVTYISNKENYPVHEKIFILFMTSSICYMLATCCVSNMTRHKAATKLEEKSYRLKFFLFVVISIFTSGLLFFFYKHRFHCEELAFSWFSLCEYVICATNMAFHATIAWDMGDQEIFVGKPALRNGDVTHKRD